MSYDGLIHDSVEGLLERIAALEAERDELRASFRLVSDTLDALQAENARQQRDYGDAEASIETLTARLGEAEAENARLKASISPEEREAWFSWFDDHGVYLATNYAVDSLIAARASAEVKP